MIRSWQELFLFIYVCELCTFKIKWEHFITSVKIILYKMQSRIFVNFVSAVYTLVPNIKMCLTRSNFSLTIVIAGVEKQACDSVGELSV